MRAIYMLTLEIEGEVTSKDLETIQGHLDNDVLDAIDTVREKSGFTIIVGETALHEKFDPEVE